MKRGLPLLVAFAVWLVYLGFRAGVGLPMLAGVCLWIYLTEWFDEKSKNAAIARERERARHARRRRPR